MSPPILSAKKEKDSKPIIGLFDSYSTYTIQNPPPNIPETIQVPRRFAWQINDWGFFATGGHSQIQGPAVGSDEKLYLKRKSKSPITEQEIQKAASIGNQVWNNSHSFFAVKDPSSGKTTLFMRYFKQCIALNDFLIKRWSSNDFFSSASAGDCSHILLAAMKAIQEMHAADINHYDIKPENLLFNPERGRIAVIDFDGATQGDTNDPSVCETIARTLCYASQDLMNRINGKAKIKFTKNDDLYSLGITLFDIYYEFHPEKEGFQQLLLKTIYSEQNDAYKALCVERQDIIYPMDALFQLIARGKIPDLEAKMQNSGLSSQFIQFITWLCPFLKAHLSEQTNLSGNYSCLFLQERAQAMQAFFPEINENPLFNELTQNPTAKFELNKFVTEPTAVSAPFNKALYFKYVLILGVILSGIVAATEWLSYYIYESDTDLGGNENWHTDLNHTIGDLGELPAYVTTPCLIGFGSAALASPLIYRSTVSKNNGIRSSNQ